MSDYAAIPCSEKENSVSIDFDALTGDINASVELYCDWSQRWALVADLLNNGRTFPEYGAGAPVALKASIKPYGTMFGFGQSCAYSEAIVTVSYATRKYDAVGPYDIVAESIEPSAEYRKLPFADFRWTSKTGDPLVEDEAPGKLEVKLTLTRQIFKVPAPLSVLTLSATGKVHDAPYRSPLLGLNFDGDVLLYLEPSFERTIRNDGSDGVNYTQKWAIKPTGWNKFYRAKTGTYEYMYRTTDEGTDEFTPYERANLVELLG